MKYGRGFAFLSSVLALLLLLGCGAQDAGLPEATPAPEADAALKSTPGIRTSSTLVGFIIPSEGTFEACAAMHGFLRTAENLGYPAKLYHSAYGKEAEAAVDQANADGCKGLLIWNPQESNKEAIARAIALSIPVVVPYYETKQPGVAANTVADLSGYSEEVALGIAERMVERECKLGKILVYGKNPKTVYDAFTTAITTYYPQYNVDQFVRKAISDEAAIEELSTYLLWNRDVKGLFCTDPEGTGVAAEGREKAKRDFRANGAPEAAAVTTPDSQEAAVVTPRPGATPVPEGLTKTINITVAGMGLLKENIALIKSNDIYAFVAEPYYTACAQGLMALDRVLCGQSVPERTRVNMPIIRQDTVEKYELIYDQVLEWFDLDLK